MGPVRLLTDQFGVLLGRALSLGEPASLVLARVLFIGLVLFLGWLAYQLVTGFIARLVDRLGARAEDAATVQRARTLGPLLTSTARYVLGFVAGMLVLQELGVDVRALAVSAGVVGLAVGFGAQSLIRDVITGFFLLFEHLIAVGDVVEVGPHTGVVESVGLRVTKIRKFSGELRIVPNGDLTTFGHHSAGWGRAVVEVAIHPEADAGRALRVLAEAGRAWRDAHPADVLEAPTAEGLLRLAPSEVALRLHARVRVEPKFALELELRMRVKEALDAARIRAGVSQTIVHLDPEQGGTRLDRSPKESLA
jgi:small conductance mechanosensitive channel